MNAKFWIGMFVIVAVALSGYGLHQTLAARQAPNLWLIGSHAAGLELTFDLNIPRAQWHDATYSFPLHGMDVVATSGSNDWGNSVTLVQSGDVVTVTVTAAKPGQDPVGLSAEIHFTAIVRAGYETPRSKIGVFDLPAEKQGNLVFLPLQRTKFVPSGGEIQVRLDDGYSTFFNVTGLLPNTKVTVYFGDEKSKLGTCTADCRVNAPAGTMFREGGAGWAYVTLKFEAAPGTSPTEVGILNPVAPTATPTPTVTNTPTPTSTPAATATSAATAAPTATPAATSLPTAQP